MTHGGPVCASQRAGLRACVSASRQLGAAERRVGISTRTAGTGRSSRTGSPGRRARGRPFAPRAQARSQRHFVLTRAGLVLSVTPSCQRMATRERSHGGFAAPWAGAGCDVTSTFTW